MTTTPDYAGLLERLDNHFKDAPKEVRSSTFDLLDDAAEALRTLLESNAALERERDNWAMQAVKEDDCRREWQVRASKAEAERDRLAKIVAELEAKLARTSSEEDVYRAVRVLVNGGGDE